LVTVQIDRRIELKGDKGILTELEDEEVLADMRRRWFGSEAVRELENSMQTVVNVLLEGRNASQPEYRGKYRVVVKVFLLGAKWDFAVGPAENRFILCIDVRVALKAAPEKRGGSVLFIAQASEEVAILPARHFFEAASGRMFFWVARAGEFEGWLVRDSRKQWLRRADAAPQVTIGSFGIAPVQEGKGNDRSSPQRSGQKVPNEGAQHRSAS
jgi:hypothetical protein